MNAALNLLATDRNTTASTVDDGSRDVLFFLRDSKVYNLSLGVPRNNSLALTIKELGLPDAATFVKQTRDLGLPEMLGFVTACLSVLLAVYLIKTWKQ